MFWVLKRTVLFLVPTTYILVKKKKKIHFQLRTLIWRSISLCSLLKRIFSDTFVCNFSYKLCLIYKVVVNPFRSSVLFMGNAGQLGLGSSQPESSQPGSSQPGPILSLVEMCLIKRSLFKKSWRKNV